jgi:hypothetical protein
MPVLFGVLIAVPGGLAALAGLAAMHRKRRLRRDGVSAWAMALTPPDPAGPPAGSAHRTLIQYELADGRVEERIEPQPGRRAAALRPGQRVLLWYDPDDPRNILVYGREGRLADAAFVVAGVLFMMTGAGIAAFVR